jgi:hypothetical protein
MAFLLREIGGDVKSPLFSDQAVPDRSIPPTAPVLLFQGVFNPPPREFPGHTLNSDDLFPGKFHGNDQAFQDIDPERSIGILRHTKRDPWPYLLEINHLATTVGTNKEIPGRNLERRSALRVLAPYFRLQSVPPYD